MKMEGSTNENNISTDDSESFRPKFAKRGAGEMDLRKGINLLDALNITVNDYQIESTFSFDRNLEEVAHCRKLPFMSQMIRS